MPSYLQYFTLYFLFITRFTIGENNDLKNRHHHVKSDKCINLGTPTSIIPKDENIKRLMSTLAEKQQSVKEMMATIGLKDRPNFIEYSLSPAVQEGYVQMRYSNSPRHPRQNICSP